MDAIILVGGQGTRLRPLTLHRHKSLVPVANRPAIDHLIAWLGRNGVERVVFALGIANEDLAAAYPPGRLHGVELRHVIEHERLESGGAIRNAVTEAHIDELFVVVNGDVYVDFDLGRMLDAHTATGAALSIGLTPVTDPSSFGVAVLEGAGTITRFVEKPPAGTAPSNLANAGVWVFERGLIDEIPPGAVRVEETLFPTLVEGRRGVLGYAFEGPWADIGTPARYLELNRMLAEAAGGTIAAEGALVGGAGLAGCVIGSETRISDSASVSGSVLWELVRVGEGATVADSILADGVEVGAGASVSGLVAGKGAVVPAGAIVSPGTVLQPGERYHA